MTEKLLTDIRMACRHGMTLVRQRDDVFPSALPVPADHPSRRHERQVHIVLEEVVVEPGSGLNIEPVTSCCELVFEPDTVEIVAWGTVWPHEVCVRKTGETPSFVSRVYRDASIALLEKAFAEGGRDWVRDKEGEVWTYEASFNGVFPRDRLYPRGRDIGLARLTVELPYPGTVHIHACGVRNGCSRHLARTEKFPLTDMEAVEKRIASHEIAATSVPLMELAWCLVAGDCSATLVYEPNDPGLRSNMTGTADRCGS